MISIRTTFPLLGLLVALAGCSGETGAAPTAATVAQNDSTSATAQASFDKGHAGFHHGHVGGQEFLLHAALREPSLNLTAAQKTTIETAIHDSAPKAPPTFDRSRVVALAAGVRAGKVDPAALPAKTDDTSVVAERRAAQAKAIDTLHATLTADQRKALVDAVTKRMADHGRDGDHGPGQHGDHKGPPPGMERFGGDRGGPMGGLLADLNLTKAQEDAIHAKLEAARPAPPSDADRAAMKAQHEAMKTEMQARLQTFAADKFDANAFVAPPANAPQAPKDHADHMATEIAIITSVLEPAQREKLATRLEQGPPSRAAMAPAPAAAPAPAVIDSNIGH